MKKTNAIRLLEVKKVPFRTLAYEVDPEDLSAIAVARKIEFPVEQVWKTLLVEGQRERYFAVIPGASELNLKATAKVLGEKKLNMVPMKDIEKLTGYIRGGVTVLGAKKPFAVVCDASIRDHSEISISAGVRGQQILLSPADYLKVVNAKLGDISSVPV